MGSFRSGLAAAVAVGATALAPGVAGAVDPASEQERVLTGAELESRMQGAELYGCYVDGRPAWGERTAPDGTLYDLKDADSAVGRWWVERDSVCYMYDRTPPGGPFCFEVLDTGEELQFYSSDTGVLVARTRCTPVGMM